MIISWKNIETHLLENKASNNEVNTHRQIYNNDMFQVFIVRDYGLVTEKFLGFDENEKLEKISGVLVDLGELDTYELIEFIEENQLSQRQASSITPQQLGLLGEDQVKKVTDILIAGLNTPDAIRYSLSMIVQTGFPYKRISGKQHYERKNGDLTVTMSAPNDIGLPTGMYPRLAFVHFCSEIVKMKDSENRVIDLGPSLKRFVVDELGKPWTTGKKGTAAKWKETIISLLATSFTSFFKSKDSSNGVETVNLENVTIANKATLWWDAEYDDLKGAKIEVSEAFAEVLLKRAVPLDYNALKKLGDLRSPLAFDLYCWLTYRYWSMEQNKESIVRISWKQLYEQLGTGISTIRHFIREIRSGLVEVKKIYPQALFNTENDNYLILFPSKPHVTPERINSQLDLISDTEKPL